MPAAGPTGGFFGLGQDTTRKAGYTYEGKSRQRKGKDNGDVLCGDFDREEI